MRVLITTSALVLGLCLSVSGIAKQSAQVELGSGQISFKTMQYNQKGILKVNGPNGFFKEYHLEEGQSNLPLYELNLKNDGFYKYEVVLSVVNGEETITDPANGRHNAVRQIVQSEKLSGHFNLKGGEFVQLGEEAPFDQISKELGESHEH
ncbi:MAG: hypothetical protein HWD86_02135 [Kangiellaceae bacterium]|nr:hypothetical protein [Kangiellaceae bacterium]